MPTLFAFHVLSLCLVASVHAKGVLVKFLPNPPTDSIAHYDVYRSERPESLGEAVGLILPAPGQDTLRYPDLAVEPGRPYHYTVQAVNRQGLESDPSDPTRVAVPMLSLPDTLRPDAAGRARVILPAVAHPLLGFEPLTVSLARIFAPDGSASGDTARFAIAFDDATGELVFSPRSAAGDTARIAVRASYFGKFEAIDTLAVLIPRGGATPIALRAVKSALLLTASFTPGLGLFVRTDHRGTGWVEILSPTGRMMLRRAFNRPAGPEAAPMRLDWNGRGIGYGERNLIAVLKDGNGRVLGRTGVDVGR